ncbi:MAG TPA: hypothetical protein VGP93_19655 [Polyangiaceae bacterium]|nr:hypothetical protein [Polyangiaceae bacterium]
MLFRLQLQHFLAPPAERTSLPAKIDADRTHQVASLQMAVFAPALNAARGGSIEDE